MKDNNDSIAEAEHEVKQAHDEVEQALNHLEEKLKDNVKTFVKFKNAAINPLIITGIAVVTGIFFGQLLRISFRKKD